MQTRVGWIKLALIGGALLAGCVGAGRQTTQCPADSATLADSAALEEFATPTRAESDHSHLHNILSKTSSAANAEDSRSTSRKRVAITAQLSAGGAANHQSEGVKSDSHDGSPDVVTKTNIVTIDGKPYLVLVTEQNRSREVQHAHAEEVIESKDGLVPESPEPVEELPVSIPDAATYPLDLPTALALVGGQHPTVGFAQWRVQEAYAQLQQAEILWLPSLQGGVSFHRHDGNYQASNGTIVDVNRSSFQYGFGSGATGAGTTPRPGLIAQFHLKDAIFQPEIVEKTAWAYGHAANGNYQKQLLKVALGYLELLRAEQDLKILEESHQRTADLARLTEDFAETGQGLRADADRLRTEVVLVKSRMVETKEQADVASSRLAQALSFNAAKRIVPVDPSVVPIELVSRDFDTATLISTGLAQRPELKEAQALVAAACERYQKEKFSPFVPSVLLGFSTTGFGGGIGSAIDDVDGRYDFDALLTWEVRNLGLGEKCSRREMSARIQQAKYEKIRVLDQVAQEISEAHSQAVHRAERIEITEGAIQSALNSFERNLSRIRDGQGLPIEVLQSVRALEDAQRAYLKAVVDYNDAQFRLQWALGWPVAAATNGG